jgi:hypothetical protein
MQVHPKRSACRNRSALIHVSEFGKPQPCKNNCGGWIYFDRDSKMGHPSPDKWIPLQYDKDNGIKTDEPHHCPNRPSYGGSNGGSGSTSKLPMTESEAEIAAALDLKATAETTSKEDRIINMMNSMMVKLDRLIGLLEEKKDNKQVD